jgi:hypothetical protein
MRLTPYVTFGFGSVLGFVREGELIAHDDDMDLLVAFREEPDCCFKDAKMALRRHLVSDGFDVQNADYPTHLKVCCVDVFVGFIEDNEVVSWFPSARGGLFLSDVFPVTTKTVFDVPCRIPGNPERYLEVTYGKDWRNPDLDFGHPWDFSQYTRYRVNDFGV